MPRRLRVRFPVGSVGAPIVMSASRGTFAISGKAATLQYVPNAVIADQWVRLDNPAYAFGNSRAGPNISQGWTKQALDTSTGKVLGFQGSSTDANHGTFLFNPSLGYWERTNTEVVTWDVANKKIATGDWHRSCGTGENYDICFDSTRNIFNRNQGGPYFPSGIPGSNYATESPYSGNCQYNPATDEWSNPYPAADCIFVPLPSDAGYFGTPGVGAMGGFDARIAYSRWNDTIYQWGAFATGSSQNMKKRVMSTGVVTNNIVTFSNMPRWTGPSRTPHLVGGIDSRTHKAWSMSQNPDPNLSRRFWEWDIQTAPSAWTEIPTTGTRPVSPSPGSFSHLGEDYGQISMIDEAANCLVVWLSRAGIVQADSGPTVRKTWIMDLATRAWRDGPSLAAGHTVPPAANAVSQSMMYDPVSRRIILSIGSSNVTQVWALNIAPQGGIITSWPLPFTSGSTEGVNYYKFPYVSNGDSKHTNMCYCPLNERLYVQGGDTGGQSAVNGTWSMSTYDGSWRRDHYPTYPGTPGPNQLQDNCGMFWVAALSKMLVVPGNYYPYPPPIDPDAYPIHNWSLGMWWFDPLTNTYEQDLSLFNTAYSGVGVYGGEYDEVNGHIVAFTDSSSSISCRRYDVSGGPGTGVALTSLPFTVPTTPSGYSAKYFRRAKIAKIGRYLYVLGYRTNGVSKLALFFRWHLDNHTFEELAAPPCDPSLMEDNEIRPGVSNGKVVWPFVRGPEGTVIGIYVYNPANNTWTEDFKRPAYGNFIGNAIHSMPDGRIAFAGSAFGLQQSHIWFYQAT